MARKIGNAILAVAAIATAYGALAFFALTDLPPNGGVSGRLPSLYIMLGGMGGMLIGSVARDLRLSGTKRGD